MILSIFGLGKLGCSTLAVMAEKFKVIGTDISKATVQALKEHRCPIYEPGVEELLKACSGNITVVSNGKSAADMSDVSFIIVPTPSKSDGSFDTRFAGAAANEIALSIKEKSTYHLIVLTSTVLPGDSRKLIRSIEKISEKKCGEDFGFCYNPDFIALGSIVDNLHNPDMILIGESDKKAGDILEDIHSTITDNSPSIHRMTFENAELSKIALNSYCTMKITFANLIQRACDKIPEGFSPAVTDAIGSDKRIGHNYFKGGLSFGGPCFPRDNRALAYFLDAIGVDKDIQISIDRSNVNHNIHWAEKILKERWKKMVVMGITYKPNSTLQEESAAKAIMLLVSKQRPAAFIRVCDPTTCSPDIFQRDIDWADMVFIGTPWNEFKGLDYEGKIILDPWGFLE